MASSRTERLQELIRLSGSANDPRMKAALSRLASEIRGRSTRAESSSDYFVSALHALSRLKGSANHEIRMQCTRDCLFYFYTSGLLKEGLEAAEQLRHLAHASRSDNWTRIAETFSGIMYGDMGNVAGAVEHYARALALAISIRDEDAQISVLVNLGSSLNYGGLYREAIPCFLRAVEVCRLTPLHATFQASALCNLAQSYHSLGNIGESYEAIARAIELSAEPHTAFDCYNRTVREFTYVRVALENREIAAARTRLQHCRKYSLQCGSVRAHFLATIAEGLCEISAGTVDHGLMLIERALNSSVTDAGPYRAEALKALVKAYDEAGKPEQALVCLRELLSYIRSVREKSVLALFSQTVYPISASLPAEFNDLHVLTHKEAELRAQVAERHLAATHVEMLERLAITADLKDESSGQHGYRVGTLSRLLALELGFSRDQCFNIEIAARLHDVGKIGVPDRILLSPMTLAVAERDFVSAHTTIGAEILSKSNIAQLSIAEEIARCHHEWWNGQGYPAKLAGKRIPIHARIVALADVFDALTHGRPFAPPWSNSQALEEIQSRKGTQFDPELAERFIKLIQRLTSDHRILDDVLGRSSSDSTFLQARNRIHDLLAEVRQRETKGTVESALETSH